MPYVDIVMAVFAGTFQFAVGLKSDWIYMTRFADEQLFAAIKTGMPNAERDCAQGRVLAARPSSREKENEPSSFSSFRPLDSHSRLRPPFLLIGQETIHGRMVERRVAALAIFCLSR